MSILLFMGMRLLFALQMVASQASSSRRLVDPSVGQLLQRPQDISEVNRFLFWEPHRTVMKHVLLNAVCFLNLLGLPGFGNAMGLHNCTQIDFATSDACPEFLPLENVILSMMHQLIKQ